MLKISIITALYNSENTIEKAINSVATQSYQNYEHIIIDGKSSDRSLEIVYKMKHEKMKIFSEPDFGIYDALNKGIKKCTGDVIGFVHSDDFLPFNNTLETIISRFQDEKIDGIYGDLEYVSAVNTDKVVRKWVAKEFRNESLRCGWMPPHPTLYLQRKVYNTFGGFDTNYSISGDYDFILRFFVKTDLQIRYIDKTIYKMRIGGASNKNHKQIFLKMKEDLRALRKNRIGSYQTLVLKNLRKLGQFRLGILSLYKN